MKSIAFISQKGGSGKTTLAVHVAIAAQEDGENVALIDTDPQQSATVWSNARENDNPIVATVTPLDIDNVLEAAKSDGITLAIVDTAPHAAPQASRIAKAVDLAVVPCRPTAFDLAAISSAVDIIKAASIPAVFVLSDCPTRAVELAETRQVLSEQYNYPLAPIYITDRRAFARAVATGRAVTEFESTGKAAEEIRLLWNWIREQIA